MLMKQNLDQQPSQEQSLAIRVYIFLRDRDARIIELFFLGLNLYILTLVILPPNTYGGIEFIWRVTFQTIATLFNFMALTTHRKAIRVASSVWNAFVMSFISTALIRSSNAHAGTYVLLAILAMFVCWKINIRQE